MTDRKTPKSNPPHSLSAYHIRNLMGDLKEFTDSPKQRPGTAKEPPHEQPGRKHWLKVTVVAVQAVFAVWVADTFLCSRLFFDDPLIDLLAMKIPPLVLFYRLLLSVAAAVIVVLWGHVRKVRELETALKKSSKWLSTTLKDAAAALIAVNTHGRIIFMNPTAQALTGWELNDVVGEPLTDVCRLQSEDTGTDLDYREGLTSVIEKGEPFSITKGAILRSTDNTTASVAVKVTPIRDDDAVIIGAVAVFHDLTEFRRTEKTIKRLATVVEQADDAVLITDDKGVIEYINPTFERIAGYDRDELTGQHVKLFRRSDNKESLYEKLLTSIVSNENWRGRYGFLTKGGAERQLESTIFRIADPQGRLMNYACISRDITREVDLQNQLAQSQKMEALGRLAGGVAHDFQNILTIIEGFNSIRLSTMSKDDPAYEDAYEISKATRSANTLIQQLLIFSRKELFTPQIVNPNHVIQDMQKMLGRLMKQEVALGLDLDPTLRSVRVDANRLGQAIMNLVVNATDAMPNGGEITIQTTNIDLATNGENYRGDLRPGPFIMISVADTGPGIDKENLAHIFEPFYTTKRAGYGTGLGLSIVYGFVKELKGDVRVYSELGHGATFEILLPAVPAESGA